MSDAHDSLPPVILAVAPNGARKTKADHPALPISPAELAATAAACAEAGAAMIHLHVRDEAGGHSLDVEAYRAAIAAIRAAVGDRLVIQVTSEAVGRYKPQEQMAMVRALRPEAVSLAPRELLPEDPDGGADEGEVADFLAWLDTEGILPQFILYAADELERFDDLQTRGVIPAGQRFLLFVLGRYSKTQESRPAELLPFVAANRRGHPWAVCAFGRRETACAIAAMTLDGHARVGFENNLHLPDGGLAPDNAALVAAAARGAAALARPLADAAGARNLMAPR